VGSSTSAQMRFRSSRFRGRYHFVSIAIVLAAGGTLAAVGSGLSDGGSSGGGSRATGAPAPTEGGTLTVALGAAPGSLDPARLADQASATLVWNLMDPLVRLGDDLEPRPGLARSWTVSPDGRRLTFHLHENARWTNGDPVTARDVAYAWRRVLSPDIDSAHAPRLFGVKGAAAFHRCIGLFQCRRLARALGIRARGVHELVVTLDRPRPWFPVQLAHPALVAVHPETVRRFGDEWTSPQRIVTNGPFVLARLGETSVSLVKNPDWRGAVDVELARVEALVISNATARVQAFDAGDVMALDGSGLPATELPALRERREFETYAALSTYAYAFNTDSVSDVRQRRAMALAIDRTALVENVTQLGEAPATGLSPPELVGDDEQRVSPWLPPDGDVGVAREELERAADVERRITLAHPDAPGHRAIALAVREAWRDLGIETTIRAVDAERYLDSQGPFRQGDVYQLDLAYGLPEALPGLVVWTCEADRNKTDWCSPGYDRLLKRARRETSGAGRRTLYERAEELLVGEQGAMPVVPIFWRTYPNLESLRVAESLEIEPHGVIDLTGVELR
jgi:oligopeptide transport system substrate-binding protein